MACNGAAAEWHATAAGVDTAVDSRIRELEQLVAQQGIRFTELQHRVKNDLQLVIALLGIQKRQVGDDAAAELEVARGRIEAIARLHDEMMEPGIEGEVDAKVQLERLITAARALTSSQIVIESDLGEHPWPLSAKQTVAVMMLTHELVTNAVKHAFPSGRMGRILVERRHEADSEILAVVDDGVGTAPSGQALHTGRRIVDALCQQLGAETLVKSGTGGTRTEIRFPQRPYGSR